MIEKEFYIKLDKFIENLDDNKNELPALNYIYKELGEIPEELIGYISKKMDIWESGIRGTIDFYPKFKKKTDKNIVEITYCNGVCCGSKNNEIIPELQAVLRNDIKFSKVKLELSIVKCFGRCKKAPNIKVGNTIYENMNLQKIIDIIKEKIDVS